jgi:hypothetical protein
VTIEPRLIRRDGGGYQAESNNGDRAGRRSHEDTSMLNGFGASCLA